jgi:hypothetical protein
MWKPHLLPPYWAYRGALHELLLIPSGLCLPKNIHTPFRAPLYVLSMSLCPSRVRLLGITGCLSFLRWLRVFTYRVYASYEALDLIGSIVTYYFFFFFPSDYARVSVRSIYCIN